MRTSMVATVMLTIGLVGCAAEPGRTITNSVGMRLTLIPPGTFTMGSPKSEPGRIPNETQRQVTFNKDFRIGVTEVTQKQWRQVMGANPSFFEGDDLPVECITWHEAEAFCRKLSEKENKRYRLPTEAEWEYACRAGTTTAYDTGPDEASLAAAAWYRGNSGNRSHPVAQKAPNAWGLYDMHGNVGEWCANDPERKPFSAGSKQIEREEESGRDIRGGSWGLGANDCRSASRFRNDADYRYFDTGMRVLLELDF